MEQKKKDDLLILSKLKGCTLNGNPACVYGRKLDFAIVAELYGALEVEYSWEAVERILDKGGKFSTL